MLNLFRKNRPEKCFVLALDIGTEFIKTLIYETDGSKGRIIGVGKCRQKLGDMQAGTITDIASVIKNCNTAIKNAERIADATPERMILGVAGELVKGVTTKITYIRKTPESKINMDELRNMIHKVQWKAYDKAREELAFETGHNEIDVKLVNAAIVDVRIDGYKVSNPIGFEGREVAMNVFNAFSPLAHFGALQTIAAELDVELLAITSEPYAISRSIPTEDDGHMSTIFIDVGGGTTDIAIVVDGGLQGTKMFSLGGRSFTKRLSQELNISFDEAEEIKIAYSLERLEQQSSKIVREAMQSDSEVWLAGVLLTLSEFENIETFPSRILLSGGGSKLPEIKDTLESRDWYKKLPFARKPQISFMKPKYISSLTDETGKIADQQDITPMALAHLGIEYAGEEKVISSLLRKVVRITS